MKNTHEINMTEGPLFRQLLQFWAPLTLSSLLQIAFNAVDLIVVGRFGRPNALAAVGSNTALISLLVNLLTGFSIGGGVLCARFYGAGDADSLRRTVSTSLFTGLVGGVIIGAAGCALSLPLLKLIGSPPEVAPLAAVYLRIYFLGMPVMGLYNFAGAQLRSVGDTRRPLQFLAVAGVLNGLMNVFFVVVLGIDVAGVALATVLSQCVSCVLTVRCLLRSRELTLRELRFSRPIFKKILRLGLPAGIQGSLFSVSNFLIQGAVNSFGAAAVAGHAAAQSLDSFLFCGMDAGSQTVTTAMSQNLGAGRSDRLVRAARECMALVSVFSLAGSVLIMVFRRPLLSLYTTDPAALEMAAVRQQLLTAFSLFNGTMAVSSGIPRGMGYSTLPAAVTFAGVCAFRIAWLYTAFAAMPTPRVLYISYPVSWVLTTCAHMVCWAVIKKRDLPRLTAKKE